MRIDWKVGVSVTTLVKMNAEGQSALSRGSSKVLHTLVDFLHQLGKMTAVIKKNY